MLGRAIMSSALLSVALTVPAANFSTVTGDGATSLDTTAQTLSITYGTTATSLRGSFPVTIGTRYRVSWEMSGTTGGQAGFGTSLGGPQYRPTLGGTNGTNTFELVAETATLYLTFQRASAGTTVFGPITIEEIPARTFTDLSPQPVSAATWTTLSAGVTVDNTTGIITIPAAGTMLSARGSVTTTIGKLYRLRWTLNSNSAQILIGTSNGGSQLKSGSSSQNAGTYAFEFTATTTTTWLQFQRQTAGTVTVSDIALQETT